MKLYDPFLEFFSSKLYTNWLDPGQGFCNTGQCVIWLARLRMHFTQLGCVARLGSGDLEQGGSKLDQGLTWIVRDGIEPDPILVGICVSSLLSLRLALFNSLLTRFSPLGRCRPWSNRISPKQLELVLIWLA